VFEGFQTTTIRVDGASIFVVCPDLGVTVARGDRREPSTTPATRSAPSRSSAQSSSAEATPRCQATSRSDLELLDDRRLSNSVIYPRYRIPT
jgi:hypothetical protein